MVQEHIDHRRYEQREVYSLPSDRGKHSFGIEAPDEVHCAAAHQRRQHLGAGDMADRRDREKAGVVRDSEIRQHGAGEARKFPMASQRPLGFARRATRVTERGDVVRSREVPRRSAADGLRGREQIDAIFRAAERENVADARGSRREFATAQPKRIGVDHQDLGFAILDLIDLIVKRSQRMQPSGRQPANLRRDANTPGVRSIGAQQRHARALIRAGVEQEPLHATDLFDHPPICDRPAWPTERRPRRVAPESPKRLRADSRRGMQQVGHAFLPLILSSADNGANVAR